MIRLYILIVLIAASCNGIEETQQRHPRSHGYAMSLFSMGKLLKLKEQSVNNLKNYVDSLRIHQQQVESALKQIQELLDNSKRLQYTSNAIHQFSLSRHIYADWSKWLEFMRRPIGVNEIDQAAELRPLLPTGTDYWEALDAIYRLQTTYELDSADMAGGILRGKRYSRKKWGPLECAMMGLFYFFEKRFEDAEYWFELALFYYDEHKYPKVVELLNWKYINILELAIEATKGYGRYAASLVYADEAVALEPDNAYLKAQLKSLQQRYQLPYEPKQAEVEDIPSKVDCRKPRPTLLNGVYCRYVQSTPFLKLAPIKMEQLARDSSISLYHDMISDAEIAELQFLAKPLLKRSQFWNWATNTSADVYGGYRTCQSTRLNDSQYEVTRVLTRRISAATGLSLIDAEQFSVVNYGIAGHIDTHMDYANATSGGEWEVGDRTITALLYMSSVKQGGETVFPLRDLSVPPNKGSMLVFYNLLLDGRPDTTTSHISCPIIIGDKWIATKWVRDKPQMFIRRCPLKPIAQPSF